MCTNIHQHVTIQRELRTGGIVMYEGSINDKVLAEIVSLAQKHNIDKVILFGSRARGDYHRSSDIDLAVYGGNVTEFSLDVEELTSTLLMYDVIDMNQNHKAEFVDSILKEGKVIYEKI